MPFPIPQQLLQRISVLNGAPVAIALCPDFEVGSWRYRQLAEHLFDWLPDVALRPPEREALLYEPNKQLARSCRRLFDTKDPSRRGEIGEVLLHAVCRQEFGTAPFVARLFYKMRSNDSVTSIDVAHLLFDDTTKKLELWLGEAKLYDNIAQAKYAALASVKPLWDAEFLTEMKALIGPKVEASAPYAEQLSWLFSEETSLDEIIERIVIPICIAADYDETAKATKCDAAYIAKVEQELEEVRAYFVERIPTDVQFVCMLIPMDSKDKLENKFNERVQSYL